jgi:hypothetical protein
MAARNAASFVELTHADSLTLLVDGERLTEPAARHNTKAEVELTLQGLVESRIFGQVRRVALVLTKLDAVCGSGRRGAIEAEFEGIVQRLTRKFGHHMHEMVAFQVAASPSDIQNIPRGHGVSALFKYWLGTRAPERSSSTPLQLERFFQRFSDK